VVFAIDSVPAAFAVTEEPFIVYSSNVFAILGLRALYVVLAGALAELRYLRIGLSAVLAFAGFKMLGARWVHIPPLLSVGVIIACIGVAVIASVVHRRRRAAISLHELTHQREQS
jgi:tellurite resistance protein TerC